MIYCKRESEVKDKLTTEEINAVKIATSLMAMNNIYYRFTHLIEDKEYLQMHTGLRMKMLNEHKIDKNNFDWVKVDKEKIEDADSDE